MAEEKKETQAVPNLVFGDAFAAQEPEAAEEAVEEKQETVNLKIDDSMLSDAEKEAVDQFAEQIDIMNTTGIMQYGAGAQKKLADFSDKTLHQARTKDLGEVGDLLANVVTEVKAFNTDATEQKGFMGLFKKTRASIASMKARYDKADNTITSICNNLENHQVTLLKDVEILDEMYDKNMDSYKELTMYILAGKKKLEEIRATELAELQKKAEETGKAEDAQAARDLADQCDRFEKKLYDLDLSRTISMQTAPQIRLLQSTDTQMAEKIQSVILNTIPLWKNQMVIALGVAHSQDAIKAESAVTNATNELLKKNAETLHMASVEAAKANQRGIVDIETLKETNQKLLTTLEEVMQVQKDGKAKRAEAEVELRKMEVELKNKLLEMSQK